MESQQFVESYFLVLQVTFPTSKTASPPRHSPNPSLVSQRHCQVHPGPAHQFQGPLCGLWPRVERCGCVRRSLIRCLLEAARAVAYYRRSLEHSGTALFLCYLLLSYIVLQLSYFIRGLWVSGTTAMPFTMRMSNFCVSVRFTDIIFVVETRPKSQTSTGFETIFERNSHVFILSASRPTWTISQDPVHRIEVISGHPIALF